MTRVTLTDRANAEIGAARRRASPEVACGLLLGWIEDDACWVDRALVCRNAAADRSAGFAIEPGVLLNVRRSLEGRDLSIVGFFYAAAEGSGEPTATDRESLGHWPGMAWLIAAGTEGGTRVWWLDHGTREVRELLVHGAAPRLALAGCPE